MKKDHMKKDKTKKKKRTRTGRADLADAVLESKPATLAFAILVILCGLFMALSQRNNKPIPREEAIVYTGEFSKYRSVKNDCTIYFADGTTQNVYPHTERREFRERMESLEAGTTLYLLIHSKNHYTVEIRTDTEELLNFEAAQAAIDSYDNGYIGIGVFMCFCGVFLIVYAVVASPAKKREDRHQSQKSKKRGEGTDDLPLRRVEPALKSKILLEARVGDYTICYRRVRHVNELVVNGDVYDERRGIIEFEHRLTAVIDGHTIEAGLDRESFSYLLFDGEEISRKRRLI